MTSTIEYIINDICNQSELDQMTERFVEVFLPTESTRLTTTTTKSNLDSSMNKTTTVQSSKPMNRSAAAIKGECNNALNYGKSINILPKVQQLSQDALGKMKKIESECAQSLGQYKDQFMEILNSTATQLSKSKKLNIKTFNNSIAKSIKDFYERYIVGSREAKTVLDYNANNQYTSGKVALSENSKWTECVNPFYEGDYYYDYDYDNSWSSSRLGRTTGRIVRSKPMKATLLTLVTFAVTMVLTNVVRIYLGGTPGGQFTTSWGLGLFQFFSCLFIAPIVEEPAKMISVKGGYGKHFFFAFNLLEFGGYILMFLHLGTASIGFVIILRAISVIFHAITMKIHQSAQNQGPVKTGIKLGICILLHFMFNAVALKYSFMGIAGVPMLLFAIGFMGVAYGVFAVARKGISAIANRRG